MQFQIRAPMGIRSNKNELIILMISDHGATMQVCHVAEYMEHNWVNSDI